MNPEIPAHTCVETGNVCLKSNHGVRRFIMLAGVPVVVVTRAKKYQRGRWWISNQRAKRATMGRDGGLRLG